MFHKEPAFQPLAYGLVAKAYGQNTYVHTSSAITEGMSLSTMLPALWG